MIHFTTRKIAHFTEYAILGFLAARAFRTSPRPAIRDRWLLICVTMIVVYALMDEFHQSFVPGRTPDVNDWLVDIAGAAVAIIACRAMAAAIARRRQSRAV